MICPECNGIGESIYYVETHRDENSVTVEQRKGICRTCNGSGKKPQTNADRIRAMTDEELAHFLASKTVNIENHRMLEQGHAPTATQLSALGATMHDILIMWLKQPAEEEKTVTEGH